MVELSHLTAGALQILVEPSTAGFDTKLASRLTSAERVAQQTATRVGASVDSIATSSARLAEKTTVAQLRSVAATERYNQLLVSQRATVAQLASAQAAQMTAAQRLASVQREGAAAAEAQVTATHRAGFLGVAGTLGATAAAVGLVKAYRDGVKEAADYQRANVQTDNVLASTGGTADVTAGHVRGLSEDIAHYSGITDTAVIRSQNLLLTFTGITDAGPDKIFTRAEKAAADMAVAFSTAHGTSIDLTSSSQVLGKALNDPAKGLDALRRAGVAFTAQQKAQVKALTDAGRTVEAQSLILDFVNQKVGGSAESFGKTAEGSAARAKVAYEEFSRSFATSVLPVLTQAENTMTATITFFQDHPVVRDATFGGAAAVGGLVAIYKTEQLIANLRKSEVLTTAARLLGFRSLEGAQVRLAAAEDRHAEAAGRVAAAETAAAEATAASGEAAVAAGAEQTVAAGGAGGGLLAKARRFLTGRGAVAAEGAAGEAALAGAALPVALGAGLVASAGIGVLGFRHAQQSRHADALVQQLLGAQAQEPGGYSDRRIATTIDKLQSGGSLLGGNGSAIKQATELLKQLNDQRAHYNSTVSSGSRLLRADADGHQVVIAALGAEADALYDADLARGRSLQKRADAAAKAYQQALTFQRQVAGGNSDAVKAIESVIGVGQAGLFDPVTKAAKSAAGSALGAESAQVSADSAAAAVKRAQDRVDALRGKGATGSSAQILAAEDRLSNARTAKNYSPLAVAAAEARLATLRSGSGSSGAQKLAAAEDSLRLARERAGLAQDRLTSSEGNAAKARQSTALSVQDILGRAEDQTRVQQETEAAARELVHKGVQQPVMAELLKLDQTAPGTFSRVARDINSAGVRALNKDERLKEAARTGLEVAFASANTKAAQRAAAKSASLAAQAWQTAYLQALKSPEFWTLLNTDLGRLLAGNMPGVLPKGDQPAPTGTTGPVGSLPSTLYPGVPGVTVKGDLVITGPTARQVQADIRTQTRRKRAAL